MRHVNNRYVMPGSRLIAAALIIWVAYTRHKAVHRKIYPAMEGAKQVVGQRGLLRHWPKWYDVGVGEYYNQR